MIPPHLVINNILTLPFRLWVMLQLLQTTQLDRYTLLFSPLQSSSTLQTLVEM